MSGHDEALAEAFDGQSAQFEKAPVQTDPAALERLVQFAALPEGSHVLDVGCGPGLVAEAFLKAGLRVTGVDLSAQMIERARKRCEAYGESARFAQGSLYDPGLTGGFDAAVSRYVLHHVKEPSRFLERQVQLLKPSGVLALCDHVTDANAERARWHQEVEKLRDKTHTRNLSAGEVVDLLGTCGLVRVRVEEEPFSLDFDEWFDRGTPVAGKAEVRAKLLAGSARGFRPREEGRGVAMDCIRLLVRGEKGASGTVG